MRENLREGRRLAENESYLGSVREGVDERE